MKKIIVTLCVVALCGNFLVGCKKDDNNTPDTPTPDNTQPTETSFMTYALKTYDTNGNGQLEEAEIDNVTELNLSNKGLTDLDGLEKFIYLETLNASKNNLTSVTLRSNVLNVVDLSQNKLTKLDISNNTGLNYAQATFNAQQNPNLNCIKVNNNQWGLIRTYRNNWLKDDVASFSLTCN